MALKKYIIYAPGYSKSSGARALYMLHDRLRAKGYEAYIFCLGTRVGDYHYIENLSGDMKKNDIVIYPEIIMGNPLQFAHVVRWVLFFPGVNGGAKSYHPGEMAFVWNKLYYDAPELAMPCVDASLFFDAGLQKTQDCYYVHKGGKWRYIEEIEGLLEINMDFPKTREQLARLLQTTGTLYSFDGHSALNDEAWFCGAKVKLVTADGLIDFESQASRDMDFYDRQLDFFIEASQSMAPAGEIEKLSFSERWTLTRKMLFFLLFTRLEAIFGTRFLAKKVGRYRKFLKIYGAVPYSQASAGMSEHQPPG